jgi:hypothetical protein
MRRSLIALFFAFVTLIPGALAQRTGYYPSNGPDEAQQVSLIQLIANPQAYDHKLVRVIGYLDLQFEGNAIYFHSGDFEHAIYENSIWINLPKDISPTQIKSVNDHYVICTARFIANRHGHMGMFSGEFDDVRRLEVWR